LTLLFFVFHADSTREHLSEDLRHILAKQGTLAQFSCPCAHCQNGIAEHKHHHILETQRALMIASFIPPHFWVSFVSTVTYLINIQPSSALQGGISFDHLCGMMPDYSSLRLFDCVCYVLLAPHERTKLIAQSVECIFLGYSAEHKGYRCWDPIVYRMQTSWDVVFDKSHPFYPRPSSDISPASLVDSLSFLLFPDAPSAPFPISYTSLPSPLVPSSVSSSGLFHVVPDYMVKPLVTQAYSYRRARPYDAPSSDDSSSSSVEDVSSSPSVEDVTSSPSIEDVPYSPFIESSSSDDCSPKQIIKRSHCLYWPPLCYSPSAFICNGFF
jgi:hypothetical protein